jgi:hypothetical protein
MNSCFKNWVFFGCSNELRAFCGHSQFERRKVIVGKLVGSVADPDP